MIKTTLFSTIYAMNDTEKNATFGLEDDDHPSDQVLAYDSVTTQGLTLDKPIVLIGMMGAGKSAIGRMIAAKLDLPFVDADNEIEAAAAMTIPEIFEKYGEDHFRYGERKVIARLLRSEIQVLATGGGAFVNDATRETILKNAISIWFKADFDILWERVSRKTHRPLLHTADPQGTLKNLIDIRYPIYQDADITVKCDAISKEDMRDRVISALSDYLMEQEAEN